MDNKIIDLLSESVLEKLSNYFESGPEHEIRKWEFSRNR